MKLIQALRIKNRFSMAIVGAGGKTTTLFHLAHQLETPVFVTTSTHLGLDQKKFADQHIVIQPGTDLRKQINDYPFKGIVLLTGPQTKDQRLAGLRKDQLAILNDISEQKNMSVLIEADGSRCLPLKAPAEHEPDIPEFVDCVLNVAGLSGIGRPFSPEIVHRYEQFEKLSNLRPGEVITTEALFNVLSHPDGGLKNIPEDARKICFLNQVDTQNPENIDSMAFSLTQSFDSVLVGHLLNCSPEQEILMVHEPVAGIILAAGGATRMGSTKVILDWKGKPLLCSVIENALEAGLSLIFVVLGSEKEKVKKAIHGYPVIIVENAEWEAGQGTSISAGVSHLPEKTGSAVFLLADQPQIPASLIKKLIRRHSETLRPIVCPKVGEKRANPVLFDNVTFSELRQLKGDAGGRQLFNRYPLEWVEWSDENILFDIDTKEDYLRLKKIE